MAWAEIYSDPRVVIAYTNPYTKERLHITHSGEDGYDLERKILDLQMQGCKIHVWSIQWWNKGYKKRFYEGLEDDS